MVGKLLVRGMLAGLVAGLVMFGFAKVVGEPQVDRAIAFEQQADAAKGEAPEPEIVSRHTQAGAGLLTGAIVYGTAVGGLFSLVFAFANGRAGKIPARELSVWLAAAAFVALVLVPALKYPANPPSVGDPETIGYRTALYFLMIAISISAMVFSIRIRGARVAQWGAWNASVLSAGVFVVIIAAVMAGLPAIDEVPKTFPAALLWNFRVASLGMQLIEGRPHLHDSGRNRGYRPGVGDDRRGLWQENVGRCRQISDRLCPARRWTIAI
ncbi:membrane protein [Caballeronia sordidicola]|uniref:Membrane protein n=1 Tax=Caballeronia sordidicola TaxID=196367 RepID=A0A158ENH9_CABSO|nr:CbtA family protein [Caballeronia sordidicola]SAL09115.1 membrane protein [Caballeronia sordidicola]